MKAANLSFLFAFLSATASWADGHVGESFAGNAQAVANGQIVGMSSVKFDTGKTLTYCFQPSGAQRQCWSEIGYKEEGGALVFGGERSRFEMRRNSNGGYDVLRFVDGKHSENILLAQQ